MQYNPYHYSNMRSARNSVLILILGIFLLIFFPTGSAITRNETSSAKSPVTVELAIFCDKEFSDIFNQDRQRIINYWSVYMWDVNMRFRTLPNLDISFKVTSLNIITNTSDQPYIETSRRKHGKVDIGTVLREFGEWIYTHETEVPTFDIAVLIFATEALDQTWRFDLYREAACKKASGINLHESTIVIKYKHAWGFDNIGLDRALGRSLGMDCERNIHRPKKTRTIRQFVLPQCSHNSFEHYVTSPAASCLHRNDNSIPDVLENATVNYPPGFDEQCKMITSNEHATASKLPNESQCLMVKCVNESLTFAGNLYPVDNSPCGTNKFCFRGRCLPQGYLVQNVDTGKCIQSTDRFSSMDYPKLVNCSKNPTPLDKLMYIVSGSDDVPNKLATPYTTPTGFQNADKCLFVENGDKLRYHNCLSESFALKFEWDLIRVGPDNKFLMLNLNTNSCATAYNNGENEVRVTTNCDHRDDKVLWKFVGDNEPPSSWFRYTITISPVSSTTAVLMNDDDANSSFAGSNIADSSQEILNIWKVSCIVILICVVFGGIVLTTFVVRRAKQSTRFVGYEKQGEVLCIAEESTPV